MAHFYRIIRNGQEIGQYSAGEIRSRLRSGEFDPFDLALLEGRGGARPIIEIDEVFDSSGVVGDASGILPEQAVEGQAFQLGNSPPLESPSDQLQQAVIPRRRRRLGGAELKKKYYLVDPKGWRRGPFNHKSIVSLARSGRLSPGVKVARQGSSSLIAVDRFIRAYSGIKKGMPPKRAGYRWHHSPGLSARTSWHRVIVGLMVIAIGALVGAGYHLHRENAKLARDKQEWLIKLYRADQRDQGKKSEPRAPTEAREGSPAIRGESATFGSMKARPLKPRPKPKAAPRQASQLKKVGRVTRRAGMSDKSAGIKRRPAALGLEGRVGQHVVLKSMKYDKRALDACRMKCQIVFKGSSGNVETVFFKAGYQDILGRPGPFEISGLVKLLGGKAVLYVQDIR